MSSVMLALVVRTLEKTFASWIMGSILCLEHQGVSLVSLAIIKTYLTAVKFTFTVKL